MPKREKVSGPSLPHGVTHMPEAQSSAGQQAAMAVNVLRLPFC